MTKIAKILTFIFFTSCVYFLYSITTVSVYAELFLPFIRSIDILVLAVITAYFVTVIIEMTVSREISMLNINVFYTLYLGFLIFTLFMPGRGATGINLNPLNIFTTSQDILIVALNFLLFAPLGFLLKLNWRNLLLVSILVLCIELSQWIFNLGYCDINDFLSNVISFVIGTQLIKIAQKLNVQIV